MSSSSIMSRRNNNSAMADLDATTGEAKYPQLRPFDEDLASDRQTMAEFYADKGVFVTGGTGFLGCVLIEALLSATPKIGNIYVLIRGKRGDNPEKRMKKMLSKKVRDFSTLSMFYISMMLLTSEVSNPIITIHQVALRARLRSICDLPARLRIKRKSSVASRRL